MGIVPHQDTARFNNGEVVMRQGEVWNGDNTHMYFILQGRFKVTVAGIPLRELSEGDHFGEMALFSQGPRTATVTCMTENNLVM